MSSLYATNLQMLLLYTANPCTLQIKEHEVQVPKQFAKKSQSLEGYLSNLREVLTSSPELQKDTPHNQKRYFRGQNIYQAQEKSTPLLDFYCKRESIIKESTPID